jgi:hypothetical protein
VQPMPGNCTFSLETIDRVSSQLESVGRQGKRSSHSLACARLRPGSKSDPQFPTIEVLFLVRTVQ